MSKLAVERSVIGGFFEQVSSARNRVLMLDYDGTIAPFQQDRRRAIPYPLVPELLRRIMVDCRTRLILVTGRAAEELPPLLGLHPTPEIWGTHGLERLYSDGRREEAEVSEEALDVLALAEALLEKEKLGDFLEVKMAGVAVHWRGQSTSKILSIRSRAYELLQPLAAKSGLFLADFEEGVELRLKSANKGTALRSVLATVDADVPVAYLGDDATDEDAFRALNGRGLTVLVKSLQRFSAAQLWLRPPDELIQFFHDWIRACQVRA